MPFYSDKGVFWRYLHETLAWPQIAEPGQLACLLHGIAAYNDKILEDIAWLRRQFLPPLAEADFLVWFGESRGITRWQADSDESYRRRVLNAFAWHKLGGKVRGLERILAENLFKAQVLPARDPALWAHFRLEVDVTGSDFDQQAGNLIFLLANEYKPARSRLEDVTTRSRTPLEERVGVGLRSRTLSRSFLYFAPPEPPVMSARLALGVGGVSSTRLCLYFPPCRPALRVGGRAGMSGITSTRLYTMKLTPRAGGHEVRDSGKIFAGQCENHDAVKTGN